METRQREPHRYQKGDRVRNIWTDEVFTVSKDGFWQAYAGGGTSDYTVEFEATEMQPTPWDKSSNLAPFVEGSTASDEGHEATYSPDDNKLRLYPACRLSKVDYETIKGAGFKWAPKQELFVAPAWSPFREDLLIEWCGDVGDEDQSKEERSADRAERFEVYRDKRRAEAGGHADTFEAGPSAFGHQNHYRAARQAARHDRHRGRALTQWDKAEYWQQRTEGVIAHALYKADPKVRRKRIKRLETELRRWTEGSRWFNHLTLRLTYERAMLENEGGAAFDVEMVAGGFIGGKQILKVNKSNATKQVVSVTVIGPSYWQTDADGNSLQVPINLNIEGFGADVYRDPTREEAEAFKVAQAAAKKERAAASKANPKPALINPTEEDARRLQAIWNANKYKYAEGDSNILKMTQKQYSVRSKGGWGAPAEAIFVGANGMQVRSNMGILIGEREPVFRVRRFDGKSMSPYRVVILTDKPQKPIPWDLMTIEAEEPAKAGLFQ